MLFKGQKRNLERLLTPSEQLSDEDDQVCHEAISVKVINIRTNILQT